MEQLNTFAMFVLQALLLAMFIVMVMSIFGGGLINAMDSIAWWVHCRCERERKHQQEKYEELKARRMKGNVVEVTVHGDMISGDEIMERLGRH